MPKAKDLKRLVRARMQKTGESYTAARVHVLKKREPEPDYARVASMSDASVRKQTGRTWAEWARVLDAAHAAEKPHQTIAEYVASLGISGWWSQMVTVGYERIRGLREKGQRRGGGYELSKSRTFGVPVEQLFEAFGNARTRGRWLPRKVAVRTVQRPKRMRVTWDDGTVVQFGFTSKGSAKSAVALSHLNLPNRASADAMRQAWSEYLVRLGQLFGR